MTQIILPCTSRETIRSLRPGDLITLKHIAAWDSKTERWRFQDDLCLIFDVTEGKISCWSTTAFEGKHKITFDENSWLTDELVLVSRG